MKIHDFINLLKTYPLDAEVKFYCPTNKIHYYIDNVIDTRIYLTSTVPVTEISYQLLIDYLQPYATKDIKLTSIKDHQDFKIP